MSVADGPHASPVVAAPAHQAASADHPTSAAPAVHPAARRRKWPWIVGLLFLAVAAAVGIPWLRDALTTVSTDDAYVNGHVTFVAPRVSGQVLRVLVDDNNRVHRGDLLVQLDREPYQVQVSIAQAAVDAAQSDLAAAQSDVRATAGKARA